MTGLPNSQSDRNLKREGLDVYLTHNRCIGRQQVECRAQHSPLLAGCCLSRRAPSGGEAAVGALYTPSIWIGVLAWLYMTFLTIRFFNQLANTESWPEGDPSRYSTAVKPAFGAGLV